MSVTPSQLSIEHVPRDTLVVHAVSMPCPLQVEMTALRLCAGQPHFLKDGTVRDSTLRDNAQYKYETVYVEGVNATVSSDC